MKKAAQGAANREKLKEILAAKKAAHDAKKAVQDAGNRNLLKATSVIAAASPPSMLIDRDELKTRYGIKYSREHQWRLEKQGLFPKAVKLTANRCGWIASEIEAWIAARAEAR